MAEYIERDAAEKELMHAMVGTGFQSRAMDAIRFMPTADVVEVVRCKDCIHFTQGMAIGMCRRVERKPIFPIGYDHFCSYGAKMDGKGDAE